MSLLAFLFLCLTGRSATLLEDDPPKDQTTPTPVAQPISFSHKQHVGLGLACQVCHSLEDSDKTSGLPSVSDCMTCHQTTKTESSEVQKLKKHHEEGGDVQWVRIYELPDFVFFNHNAHSTAKVACEACHGAVETREALWKEKDLSMKFCIACHNQRKASTACNLCHELNQ